MSSISDNLTCDNLTCDNLTCDNLTCDNHYFPLNVISVQPSSSSLKTALFHAS